MEKSEINFLLQQVNLKYRFLRVLRIQQFSQQLQTLYFSFYFCLINSMSTVYEKC